MVKYTYLPKLQVAMSTRPLLRSGNANTTLLTLFQTVLFTFGQSLSKAWSCFKEILFSCNDETSLSAICCPVALATK